MGCCDTKAPPIRRKKGAAEGKNGGDYSMTIGFIGNPNCGKTTLFNGAAFSSCRKFNVHVAVVAVYRKRLFAAVLVFGQIRAALFNRARYRIVVQFTR